MDAAGLVLASWGPEAWSAFGSLAAVVVALGIALGPVVWRWVRRPILRFDLGETEPHVRPERSGINPASAMVLRVGVANRGRLEARRVRGLISAWWYIEQSSGRWVAQDLDPSWLHWTGTAPGSGPEVSIPAGVRLFLDLIRHNVTGGQTRLILGDSGERAFSLDALQGMGDFAAEVTLLAENAAARAGVIAWHIDDKKWITNVREIGRPLAEPPGLLNIFRR